MRKLTAREKKAMAGLLVFIVYMAFGAWIRNVIAPMHHAMSPDDNAMFWALWVSMAMCMGIFTAGMHEER